MKVRKLKSGDVKDALATAEAELASLLKRAETLRQWIALTKKVGTNSSRLAGDPSAEPFIRTRRTKAVGLIMNVMGVLAQEGTPLHVDDIVEKLRALGQSPGAQNPKATIAVALSRRPDLFQKTAPNTFGLTTSTPKETVVEDS